MPYVKQYLAWFSKVAEAKSWGIWLITVVEEQLPEHHLSMWHMWKAKKKKDFQ